MAQTYSQLLATVQGHLGGRTDKNAVILRELNDAQRFIVRTALRFGHELSSLMLFQSTVTGAGTSRYALPSTIAALYDLVLIDGDSSCKLPRRGVRSKDRAYPYPENDSQGRPTEYMVFDDYFELYPVPDAVYTVRMRFAKWPTEFTTSSTTGSDIEEADDILVALTTAKVFYHLQEFDKAAEWMVIAIGAKNRSGNKPGGLLGDFIKADAYMEDLDWQAQPFDVTGANVARPPNAWANPRYGLRSY